MILVKKEIPVFIGNVDLLLADDHSFLGSDYFVLKSFEFLPCFFIFPLPNLAAIDQSEHVSASVASLKHLVAAHHTRLFSNKSF